MSFSFTKMHGAGNDFVVIDNTDKKHVFSAQTIRRICDRQRGIGADGLILLSTENEHTIRMEFFNCDGSSANMCGNGLRCAASFAYRTGMVNSKQIDFHTASGVLTAWIIDENQVKIELPLTEEFVQHDDICGYRAFKGIVGVPHLIVPVPDLENFEVVSIGSEMRNAPAFSPDGVNVDFIPDKMDFSQPIPVRTYERGVEDETLACGTGIASSAYVLWKFFAAPEKLSFLCRSGDVISIDIPANGSILNRLYLTGPAIIVFTGESGDF